MPGRMVGNEFLVTAQPRLQLATLQAPEMVAHLPASAVQVIDQPAAGPVAVAPANRAWLDLLYRQSFIVFALLFLLVTASGIEVGGRYWSGHLTASLPLSASLAKHNIAGLNLTVPAAQLNSKLASITNQPANLHIGGQTVAISPDTIKSWLKITPSPNQNQDYIHLDSQTMGQSLTALADKYAVASVNQVTVIHNGVSQVILAGQNGSQLSDPGGLNIQAQSLAKSVMNANGLNFSTPLTNQPFQAVTAAAFSKLIEVDVNTHQMYLYDNGNLTSTYAISAGAPATPTPIGEFHIWEKLAEQTMRGYNPNGTKYVQPNVQWINYFDHSGDAVHGNYWRPLSVFGNVNTSHGCVSLPNAEAEVVYNWAPIGTTVITHT
jgi:lipoprotein-anchoring transpeptidase ErfK/SrfK